MTDRIVSMLAWIERSSAPPDVKETAEMLAESYVRDRETVALLEGALSALTQRVADLVVRLKRKGMW